MTWQIENTLTYDKTIGKHIWCCIRTVCLKYKGDQLGGNRWNLVNSNKPSIDYATGNVEYTKDEMVILLVEQFSMAFMEVLIQNIECHLCLLV